MDAKTAAVSAKEAENTSLDTHQAPAINLEANFLYDTPQDMAAVTPGDDEDEEADNLFDPVMLSNGKPLKGILKHRRYSDTEGYLAGGDGHQRPVPARKLSSDAYLQGGTELTTDDESQSPRQSITKIDDVDSIAAHSG